MARRSRSAHAVATAAAALAATLAAAGCGKDDRPLPASCVQGAGPVTSALSHAPGTVRLNDGTQLSTCIERARSDGDIQNVGAVYTRVADALAVEAPESDRAALQLGYLIGAARKGAAHTNGIHVELVRRLEQAVGVSGVPPARRAAYARGLVAGRRDG